MIKGNQIHDDLFDHEGVNVTVDNDVLIAREEVGCKHWGFSCKFLNIVL